MRGYRLERGLCVHCTIVSYDLLIFRYWIIGDGKQGKEGGKGAGEGKRAKRVRARWGGRGWDVKYLHHPHSLVLLPVAVARKVALRSAWSPRAPSAVCSSHCSVHAQPGTREIQVCTAVQLRVRYLSSLSLSDYRVGKNREGVRVRERWEEGGKRRKSKRKAERTVTIIARAAAAGNRGIHPLLSLGLGRGRGDAKPEVAEHVSISDAGPQNAQWGEREREESRQQTQRRKEGRGVRAAHLRGREGATGGRKDGMRKAGTAAFTAMGGTGAGMAGVRGGGTRGGRGPGSQAEGGGRSPKPEVVHTLVTRPSRRRELGASRPSVVQKAGRTRSRERGAQRKGARAHLAMYAELG